MRKKLLALLSALTIVFTFTACEAGGFPNLDGILGGGTQSNQPENEETENGGNQDEETENGNDSSTGEGSGEGSGSGSGSGSGNSGTLDEEELETALMAGILKSAYALADGESLEGAQTLKGTVTEIHEVGKYGDLRLTFVVKGYEEYPMYCWWLVVGNEQVDVGDVITVTGTIKNYGGTIEYEKPTLLSVENPEAETGSVEQILKDAYSLGDGESLTGTYTLTGEVIDVEKTDRGDICLTFEVDGYSQYPMYCYWLQDADFIEVGYDITVSGTIKNHKGTIEFDHPELLEYGFGTNDGTDTDEGGSGGGSSGGSQGTTGTGERAVDFTKATNVKDVTDQGYYLDGCPTKGSPKVLVIPVEFSDATAVSKGYSIDKIKKAFYGGAGTTDYYSVKEYYSIASYGKLDLDITVLDSWFKPKNNSSYYIDATYEYYDEDVMIGDQLVMDEALAYLESRMDLSQFDSDNNDIIDAVVMINTLDIDYDVDMQWAYRYWNIYTDDDGYYYEYDGVSANDYLWASYAFMHEDEDGEFTDKSALNTYTYIHEFGHVLGADDYYDTAYNGGAPMDGCDIMDSMLGDHNAYSKFNYGWLTTSRLIVADSTVTVTLEDFSKNGDTIIIANNWNDKLGAYQEYFVLVYYKNTGLNEGAGGYFDDEGVVVYHVNATLTSEVYDGETYYDVANNNTSVDGSDGYGTTNNLIELVSNGKGGYVFKKGYSLSSTTKTDSGKKIAYTFTVDEVAGDKVTITFKKNS